MLHLMTERGALEEAILVGRVIYYASANVKYTLLSDKPPSIKVIILTINPH